MLKLKAGVLERGVDLQPPERDSISRKLSAGGERTKGTFRSLPTREESWLSLPVQRVPSGSRLAAGFGVLPTEFPPGAWKSPWSIILCPLLSLSSASLPGTWGGPSEVVTEGE